MYRATITASTVPMNNLVINSAMKGSLEIPFFKVIAKYFGPNNV